MLLLRELKRLDRVFTVLTKGVEEKQMSEEEVEKQLIFIIKHIAEMVLNQHKIGE